MKTGTDGWALFGAAPAFDRKLHVGQPNVGDRAYFMERLERILDLRWFTNHGECVRELEAELCRYLGVAHCVAVCNATIGLEIAIRALGMDGEVIVPSLTFVATPHALQWQQVVPVFCDVDEETHLLDPARVEALITPRTTGILPVHLWGRPCDVEALTAIAKRHRLRLLFDAAHAFGCSHGGAMVGGFGDAEVFSFHATKFFNSFEGGAIATNDAELAGRLRLMTNFGFAGYDRVVHIGTNGKMTEVAAAMGLASLRSVDSFVATNLRNHRSYRRGLAGLEGVELLGFDERERNNYQYVVVEYTPAPGGPTRDDLVDLLWAENVMARKYFWPGCHRMEPYRTLYPDVAGRLPATEAIADRLLVLPTGTGVDESDIAALCALIAAMLAEGPALRERVAAWRAASG